MAGTYVGLDLTHEDAVYLTSITKRVVREDNDGEPYYEIEQEPHCTAIYSREPIPYTATNSIYHTEIVDVEWWDGHDNRGYVVATLKSDDITALNKKLVDLGGINSFPKYRPHLTLIHGGSGRIDKTVGERRAKSLAKLLKGCEVTFSGEKVSTLNL